VHYHALWQLSKERLLPLIRFGGEFVTAAQKVLAFVLVLASLVAIYFLLGQSIKLFLGTLLVGGCFLALVIYLYRSMYSDE